MVYVFPLKGQNVDKVIKDTVPFNSRYILFCESTVKPHQSIDAKKNDGR